MRFWPAPFGKSRRYDADAVSDSQDPRFVEQDLSPLTARPIRTNNPFDKGEGRRIAKGQPERPNQEIIDAVHGRGQSKRTKVPSPGQRVQFIRDEWGDPEPATVIQVQDISQVPDDSGSLNGIRARRSGEPPDANFLINRGNDPMPLVLLVTDDGFYTWTRESRVRGACGWTP